MLIRSASILTLAAAVIAAVPAVPDPEPAPVVAPTTPAPVAAAGEFNVDVAHSMLVFRVRHLDCGYFYGRITKPKGTFLIDEANPANGRLHIVADIKNMDTGHRARDNFLTGPDFFNVREYPTAEFKSSSVRKIDATTYEAEGEFTMHGVTKPVTAKISDWTTRQTTKFGFRGGFEARITVDKSAFGMNPPVDDGILGDEVLIIAAIGGALQQ